MKSELRSRIGIQSVILFGLILAFNLGCTKEIGQTSEIVQSIPDNRSTPRSGITETAIHSPTSQPPTATEIPTTSNTPTKVNTPTSTNTSTVTATVTPSPTATQPPPTPSGDDAIYIYAIQDQSDDPKACDFIAVRLNTGVWRTGDTGSDIKSALRSLFVKRQYFGALENPAYLSNITVDSVEFKAYSGLVAIRLSGTYVRSGDRCDDSKVRAQVWTTIRQFPEVKTIDILLNGNLLGDILATGRK